MRQRILHPFRPSPGECRLLIAGVLLGGLGAVLAFVVVSQVADRGDLLRGWSLSDAWCAASGAIGGILSFYIGRRWLGRSGAVGAIRALCAVVWIGCLTALIAGTLILPGYGTMFGPMLFGTVILARPALFLAWSCGLILSHLLVREWRMERLRFAERAANWH
ncbi:hypothetical protein EU805_08775 [Salipiger sp. IMCC34102]|uniref:hypothetical protein n=1 Tax=Salipiger sp. IMCC34102 TaxID=2510647 RepID=UPI00101B70C3|nr:hypothetical protein [Salipiger sp. IMCC34102]RYH02702.1 hypothetical protein EU805_08775 [Salipiger sp. IMCC34102]